MFDDNDDDNNQTRLRVVKWREKGRKERLGEVDAEGGGHGPCGLRLASFLLLTFSGIPCHWSAISPERNCIEERAHAGH